MGSRLRDWRTEWAVWALIGLYVLFFGLLTVRQHDAFQTTAFDLGNVDQAVWNTRHGRPFQMTNIEGLSNRLGTHVEPILLPISLFYFVWSDPRTLLLLQTVVIALGAWPVYLIARRALKDTGWAGQVLAVVFAAAYLLFPALQSANTFDFHAVALAPTFFLYAFYFLETERWGWYAVFVALTMGCKEDMPLLVAMLGVYALLVRRRWRVGLATMVVAAAWFLVAVGWIMPHFDTRGVSPLANRYAHLGDGPLEMATSLVTRPGVVLERLFTAENLAYVRDLLAPVGFLSLLAPQVLMLALPPLLVNLLSSDGFMQQLEGFHYGAPLVPAVVLSAVYGAAWVVKALRGLRGVRRLPQARLLEAALPLLVAGLVLVASLAYHYGHGYTPLAATYQGWPAVEEHHRRGEEMAGRLPTDASLAALPHPNPHASQRQQLSMIDRVEEGRPAPIHEADYVWLDATHGWPLHPNDLKAGVENLLAGEYGVGEAADGWILLRRGAADKVLPDGFYDFARAGDPEPQYPMQLQFLVDGEPVLECLGFDLILQPPISGAQSPLASLQFYWRALRPLPPGLRLYPFYLDDTTGRVIEDTGQRPMIATVWYPPERWAVGEVVATSTLPWDVGPTYSVGLGVVQGDDWQDVGQRLPIRVVSSALVVRLFEGDTWARLLHVAEGEAVEEVRVYEPPAPQQAVAAEFDGQIGLRGYDLETEALESGGRRVDLTLYWQALVRPATNYTVFAQLLGPAGRARAQVDAVPQGGGYPTRWWLPGEVVVDRVSLVLPPDAPREVEYRLIVGLYDPATGDRLVVGEAGGESAGRDYVELTTVWHGE